MATRTVHTRVQFLKVCDVLRTMDMTGIKRFTELAPKLEKLVGFQVSVHQAKESCEATGIVMPDYNPRAKNGTYSRTDQKVRYIARELNRLAMKLGEPSNAALVSIAKGEKSQKEDE